MPSGRRTIAYVLAGIPAAIGVAFVARYAYATSDTLDSGLATAALYGMTAAGAFAAPAAALAVANNGRKVAAGVLGLLAVLAMVANWTNTLGAIANRGAGTEAATSKTKSDVADARKELLRLEARIEALGKFMPTTAAAVSAAKLSTDAATKAKNAECGNGDPKQRGKNCRTKEDDEAKAIAAITAAETSKATTDMAARLETEAAAIRAKIDRAPPTPSTNAIGEALGRFLPMSAVSAATAQQALVSAIVELLIAAALALPELLRPAHTTTAQELPREDGAVAATPAQELAVGSVKEFMLSCFVHAKGEKTARGAVYKRYLRWCDEHEPKLSPLPIPHFWEQFAPLCQRVKIPLKSEGNKVYCVDVKLAA